MSVTTSRVFEAARVAHTRLSAVTWPTHPVLATLVPFVTYDSTMPRAVTEHAEVISVSSSVGDDATIIANGLPDQRDEEVSLTITAVSAWGSETDVPVFDRLESLVDAIQVEVWDTDQASPTGRSKPFGANGVQTSGISRVSFDVYTSDKVAGFIGVAEVVYSLNFRI